MRNRNCVISAVGKDSVHKGWSCGEKRDFDLHLIVYDDSYESYRHDADFIVQAKGYKLKLVHEYITDNPSILEEYDYFFIPDDDIVTDSDTISLLFRYMDNYRLKIAQPSLTDSSYYTFQHTLHDQRYLLRYTNFIEMMLPCFSREALKKVLVSFAENKSGWGVEYRWSQLIESNKSDMAIIDDIQMQHVRPIQSKKRDNINELHEYITKHNLSTKISVYPHSVTRKIYTEKRVCEHKLKHAIMIMAHQNIGQITDLVRYFKEDCYLFIHIDTKSEITAEELDSLRKYEQVKWVGKKFSIHWGGYSILRCEIFLLKKALKECDADYFHLISGQDYPTRSLNRFLTYFEDIEGFNLVHYIHLPNPKWERNTFSRFQYYYPYDWVKHGKKSLPLIRKFVDFQKRHSIKRRIPDHFEHIYGGSQWFSICKEAAVKLIDYTRKKPALYRRMWMTFAPEESYIATVLVNTLPRTSIICDNARFIRWHYENGNRPANLGCEHFRYILEKEFIFARKMYGSKSEEIKKLLDRYLLNEQETFHLTQTGGWVYDGYLEYGYNPLFTQTVYQFCISNQIHSVLDMGCGTGMYVSLLREKGIAIAGYDANPYVKQLSARLLPADDQPCLMADLTDDLEVSKPFDLVLCKDVLPYIPESLEKKVLCNLNKLTGKYLLFNWNEESNDKLKRCKKEKDIIDIFSSNGFHLLDAQTTQLRVSMKDSVYNKYYVFSKY